MIESQRCVMCQTLITENSPGIILFTIFPRPTSGERVIQDGAICGNDCMRDFASKEPAPW